MDTYILQLQGRRNKIKTQFSTKFYDDSRHLSFCVSKEMTNGGTANKRTGMPLDLRGRYEFFFRAQTNSVSFLWTGLWDCVE